MPDGELPWTRVLGIKPDFKRDSRVAFLTPVEATVPVTDNSMNERTQTAFCLGPVDCSRTGAYKMFNPLTGQVVERSQFTPVPLSNYHIQLLQRCADPTNNELVFRRGSLHSAILADGVDFIRHEAPIPLEPVPQLTGVLPPINFDEIYPDADVIPTENPINDLAPTIIRAEDAPMTLPLGGETIDYRVDITHDDEHTIGGAYTEDNPDDQGFIVSDAYGFNQAVTTIDSTLPAPVPAPIVVPSDASPLRVSARSNKNVNRYLSDEYYTSKDSEYHSKDSERCVSSDAVSQASNCHSWSGGNAGFDWRNNAA